MLLGKLLSKFILIISDKGDRVDYELRVTGIPQINANFTNFP